MSSAATGGGFADFTFCFFLLLELASSSKIGLSFSFTDCKVSPTITECCASEMFKLNSIVSVFAVSSKLVSLFCESLVST